MRIIDIDAPPREPVTLEMAKQFLRVTQPDEDSLISDLILAARIRVETLTASSLITRRRLYMTDNINTAGIFVNHRPIQDVCRVGVISNSGAVTDIGLDRIDINLRVTPPVLRLTSRQSWIASAPQACGVEIEFKAGYGDLAEEIPMPLRQAILLLVADSFEHRDIGADAGSNTGHPSVPFMVDALLMPYRTLRL